MELDYDIYSYLARGIAEGILILRLVKEKVTYEIIELNTINLNNTKTNNIDRYKLQVVDSNGKKVYNEDGSPMVYYEDREALLNDYVIKTYNNKKILRKRQKFLMVVQIPQNIKVPIDNNTSKLSIIEAGKWIDITNLDDLKIYSDKRINDIFEFADEDIKIIKRV